VTRRAGAALVIVSVAVRKPLLVTGFSPNCRSNSFRFRADSFGVMLSAAKSGDSDDCDGIESDPFPNLKVFDPKDLRLYYEKTKQILLTQGSRNQNGGDAKENTQSCLSSLSLQPTNISDNKTTSTTKAFSLQHFEPRHRKSMMRCVLNQFHSDSSRKVSKTDFQQRLRLLERKQRWRMTCLLLFGDISFHGSVSNEEMLKHWWESGVIQDELAPGLIEGIREYRETRDSDEPPMKPINMVSEEKDDPKRFLSRLARGRTYKGNFRSVLEDYVDTSNQKHNDKLIPLYDKITGGDASRKLSCDESNQREVELLRSFIDELEEDTKAEDNNEKADKSIREPSTLVVNSEQISLMRKICDLDIFSSPPQSKSGILSSGSPSVDDGGRSVGKKGERDLESFLVRKHEAGGTRSSKDFSGSRVLSPVWVRPKHKNRRNTKEKCRYVLEIPRLQDVENNGSISKNKKTKTNSYVSQGTTSEFDAMVVRVINSDASDESQGSILPIMAIREVWDAKATLDPSALFDVLDKKARSLEKILCDENSNVVNLSNSAFASRDGEATTVLEEKHGVKMNAKEGANFVVLPLQENKKTSSYDRTDANTTCSATANPASSLVYRVGIDPPQMMNDDGENPGGYGRYESLPQIGVFASKMISPGAAARRIQTIVYEGLLETDLSTVKGVVCQHQGDGGTGDPTFKDDDALHCNRLLQDRSVEIVERILRLIDTLKPIVVVERFASKR